MTCRVTNAALRCVLADGHDSAEHMGRNRWTWDESAYRQSGPSEFVYGDGLKQRQELLHRAELYGFAGAEITHRCIPLDGDVRS